MIQKSGGRPTFTFAQVRAILGRLLGVHEAKQKTFDSRFQQIQKLGLPRGSNVGRSGRTKYEYWQLAELALYFDLLDAGVAPSVLVARFAELPFYLTGGYGRFVEAEGATQHLALYLNALMSLRTADATRSAPSATDHSTWTGPDPAQLLQAGEGDPNAHSPPIIVNLSRRLSQLKAIVSVIVPEYAGLSVFPPELWSR